MKIAFLCGSLEQGYDGVGDYTRRLSIELIRYGHQVVIIAVNDHYVNDAFTGTQYSEGLDVPVLRIPAIWSAKRRFNLVKEYINVFSPLWLSLQFVPFSFNKKGLIFGLRNSLKKLGEGRLWHIMFHELWVGMAKQDSKKLICWGWVQRQQIRSITLDLNPIVIHTQTQLYQLQLAKLNVKSNYLPLFSNIPTKTCLNSFSEGQKTQIKNKNKLSLVLFGVAHPNVPIEDFTDEIALYARENDLHLSLTIIGRSSHEHTRWSNIWKSLGLTVELLGEQSIQRVSEVLSNSAIGIATTAFAVIEKSGSVAAMRAHGLPILCIAPPWEPRGIKGLKSSLGIYEYKVGNLKSFFNTKLLSSPPSDVGEITQQFLNDLNNNFHT